MSLEGKGDGICEEWSFLRGGQFSRILLSQYIKILAWSEGEPMGGASKEDGLLYLMELYGNVCKLYSMSIPNSQPWVVSKVLMILLWNIWVIVILDKIWWKLLQWVINFPDNKVQLYMTSCLHTYICNVSNEAGTVYPSRAPEFNLGICGVCVSLVFCVM